MDERQAHALRDRVWGCVPVTGQAFAALLSLLDVEPSDIVETACVTTGERSRMLLNPDFVARHCRTDEHLAMLVLHELYHVVLGHTRLYPRVTPAQNWAFDCLINAQLCRLFPQPAYTSFFAQLVGDADGPGRLLAPPAGWAHDLPEVRARLLRNEAVRADPLLGDAHWRLYDDDAITTEELYRVLAKIAETAIGGQEDEDTTGEGSSDEGTPPDQPARDCASGRHKTGDDSSGTSFSTGSGFGENPRRGVRPPWTLLGDHASDDADTLHPDALREVRDIIARWPMVERRSGRDQGRLIECTEVTLGRRRVEAVRVLRRALTLAADRAGAGLAHRPERTTVDTILPFDTGRDRRAAIVRTLGGEPLLCAGQAVAIAATPLDRVRVYLDLSGSMDGVLPPLYAALAQVLDLVEPRVHGFSTRIGTLTHAQLRQGVRLSDGGTEIDAVTGHLLDGPARRAVIVTDGWVGRIPEDHLRRLREKRVRLVAVVTAGGDPSFATDAGYPVIRLPELR